MKLTLLAASILLAGAFICGFIAYANDHWTDSSSDAGFVGLHKACVTLPVIGQFCAPTNRQNVVMLLTIAGDTDPESHYDMLLATKILMIIGPSLLAAAFIFAVLFGMYLATRWLLILPLAATSLGMACTIVASAFWGALQGIALNAIPGFDPVLGPGFILAIVCSSLAAAALLLILLAYCRPDPAAKRRRAKYAAGAPSGIEMAPTAAAAGAAGAATAATVPTGNGATAPNAGSAAALDDPVAVVSTVPTYYVPPVHPQQLPA